MPQIAGPLVPEGAIIGILVGLSRSDVLNLRLALGPVPQPMQLRALVDSGADVTCLDPSVIQALALPWDRPALANMPATVGLMPSSLYRAGVNLVHSSGNTKLDFVAADLLICELPLGLLGYDAVIGRDILDRLRFLYDGPGRSFSLDY
jgi:hypothetical protein